MEVRDRILSAAFGLFLERGVSDTKLEDICERADVANRTFFNHFPTRQDMMRALADRRLLNLHDVVFDRVNEPIPTRLIGLFDDIAATLAESSDTYRELIAELLAAAGYGIQHGFAMHNTFLELVKDGVARGEVSARHDAQTLADIIVGALTGGLVNWTVDKTYSIETGLHDLAVALADLLVGDADGCDVTYLRSYDDRTREDAVLARAVLDSAVELFGEVPYDRVTLRSIARRAGVAHAAVCAHFRSTDAIVAEVYLELLRAAPLIVDVDVSARARVAALFADLVMLLEDKPGLAQACSSALISDDPSVRAIRARIHAELHRRVRTALRSGAWPEVAETLGFGLIGAMVNASCGAATLRQTADELAVMVAAVLPERH